MPKFAAGQTVFFTPNGRGRTTSRGTYKVVRVLPRENDTEFRYQIKGGSDAFERIVTESELTRA